MIWYWIILAQFLVHDFHFSRLEIVHDAESERLECTLNVFIDDLENALGLYGSDTLRLGTEKESPSSDSLILRYLEEVIQFSGDDHMAPLSLLGKEVSNDLMAFHIYFTAPFSGEKLICHNSLLLDLFEDQKNMISFKSNGKSEQVLLDNKNTKAELK